MPQTSLCDLAARTRFPGLQDRVLHLANPISAVAGVQAPAFVERRPACPVPAGICAVSLGLWEPLIWSNRPPDDFRFPAPLGGDVSGSPAVQHHGGQAAEAQGWNRNLVAQIAAADSSTPIQRVSNSAFGRPAKGRAEAVDPGICLHPVRDFFTGQALRPIVTCQWRSPLPLPARVLKGESDTA